MQRTDKQIQFQLLIYERNNNFDETIRVLLREVFEVLEINYRNVLNKIILVSTSSETQSQTKYN